MATTSKKRRVFTPQQRQDYVERFGRSGLSQAEFCRRAKIPAMTFSLWRRRAEAAAPGFAKVEVNALASSPPNPAEATLHLPNGARVELALGSEASWRGLGVLLKSLQS